MHLLTCVILALLGKSTAVIYKLNVSEYNRMPPLYALDDYEGCMAELEGVYCVVDVDLHPGDNPQLMRMIQGYSNNTMKHFNHTQIHRGVCLTTCNRTPNITQDREAFLEGCLNTSLHKNYGLEGTLANINYCDTKDDKIQIDSSDIVMAVVYLVIIVLNLVGTFYHFYYCKGEENTGSQYLLAFSIKRNWKKLTAPSNTSKEPRLERLKIFHGVRTMTMICVIFSHTSLIMSFSYVDNPLYIETSYEDPFKQILFNGSLVTHTFFVMSSFLLAYNFQLYAEKHSVSWWYLPKGIMLRWIRLTPTYAIVLFTICTWMRHLFRGPLWPLVVTSEAIACRQYWWTQLLYVNNYVYDNALCMPQTWYLAADTQLFLLGLLVCVVARKCRTRVILIAALFVVALVTVAAHTYLQDLDAVVIQTPESYRNLYATDRTFRLLYVRGHTNMATYLLGLAAGFLTYHLQNTKDLEKYKKYRWIIWLCFPTGVAFILTGGIFYIDSYTASTALKVTYATLYRPIFQILVITILMGCMFKLESTYRSVIEWSGWLWTGRVSYSAFLLHTLFQRGLVGSQLQPTHMSDYYILIVLSASIFITYIFAAVLWVLVESPAASVIRAVMQPKKQTREETL